jgi:methylase of polypeptide subunit release factors
MRLSKQILMRLNHLVRKGLFSRKCFIRAVFGVKVVAEPSVQGYCEWCTLLSHALLRKYLGPSAQVLDVGAGAHALLAICAKKRCPSISVWASDIVAERVEWAHKTAKANAVEVNCVLADMFDGLAGRFDLVLCNPPVIPSRELAELGYRPREMPGIGSRYCWSGDGGDDGLGCIRPFLAGLADHLREGGCGIMCVNPSHLSRQCVERMCADSRLNVERIHRVPGLVNGYVLVQQKAATEPKP